MLSLRDKTITQTLKTPALGDSTNVGVRKQITNPTANCSKKIQSEKLNLKVIPNPKDSNVYRKI
jgi:hypothetical protein